MVFTMALESDEARAAVEAARSAGGRLLLVPHIEGRYANVGVIAEVMEEGDLPGGLPAVAIRGDQRATIGTGVPGTGDALWVEAEPLDDARADAGRRRAGPRVPRRAREHPAQPRGAARSPRSCARSPSPAGWPTWPGYSPDLSLAQKVEVLETLDVEARLRLVLGWARDTLADLTLRERIKTDVEEGMEKTQREFLLRRQLEAIRKELGSSVATRRRRPRRLPGQDRRARPARARPHRGRARGRQARAHERPEPRDRAGSAPGSTPSSRSRGASSPRTASTSPRRSASWTPTTTGWRT